MPTPPRYLTHDGRTLTLNEWAEETGIPANTIRDRIDSRGWSVGDALSRPVAAKFRPGQRRAPGERPQCPPMRQHSSGQARVRWTVAGMEQTRYLGAWGSPEAAAAYARFAAEWAAAGGVVESLGQGIHVGDLAAQWLAWGEREYVKDGRPTSEQHCCRSAARPLVELYGDTPADEFGPIQLKAVRAAMIERGWVRGSINLHCSRIVRMFRWGVSEGLIRAEVWQSLKAVPWLRAGRGHAKENPHREPVDPATVEATIPHLHPTRRAMIGAMIRVQRLTGMRPGEVCSLRPEQVDRAADVWCYTPPGHKMQHLGTRKRIWIGPRAQSELAPFLDAAAAGSRVFPINVAGYGAAIAKAAKRAGVPHWTPHQLRHALATEVARQYASLETAAAAIGDTPATAARHYVHVDPAERAKIDVARDMG